MKFNKVKMLRRVLECLGFLLCAFCLFVLPKMTGISDGVGFGITVWILIVMSLGFNWWERSDKQDEELFNWHDHGRIRMVGANRHLKVTGIAIVVSLFALWIFRVSSPIFEYNGASPWWSFIFLIPVGISVGAMAYHWMRVKKYGVSVLELTPCPAVAGQPLRGMVHVPCGLDTEVRASLRYVHQYTVEGVKSRIVQQTDVWKDTKQAHVYKAGENASAVKVEWGIGQGYASTARHGKSGHWWELTLTSKAKGINYRATFEVPVRRLHICLKRKGKNGILSELMAE